MMKGRWLIFALFTMVAVVVFAQPVLAVGTCSGVDTNIIECSGGGDAGIWAVLELVIGILSIMVGVVAVIGITMFGIQYLTAGGSVDKATKAKRRMYEITLGLVAYVLIWGLVQWLLPGGLFTRPGGVDSISIRFPKDTIYVGETINVIATVTPKDAEDKTYSLDSSNRGIADPSGNNVKCKSVGEAEIIATSSNEVKGSATIKCVEKPKPSNSGGSGGGNNTGSGMSQHPNGAYDGSLGVAGSFADSTVVVTIFLNERGCLHNSWWDASNKGDAAARMGNGMRWLEGQMSGVSNFKLTWDTDDSELSKTITKTEGACIADNGFNGAASSIDPIVRLLNQYYPLTTAECGTRSDCVSMESLKEKYDAENVSFVLHLNSQALDNPSGGYTQLYDARANGPDISALKAANSTITGRDMTDYGYEFSVIFHQAPASNNNYLSAVCAHELLHQYGAPDLYADGWGSPGFAESPTLVPSSYAFQEVSDKEIMGSAYAYFVPLDSIRLTDITKYYIGLSPTNPSQAGVAGDWGASQHQY